MIHRLHIENYRCLYDVTVEFGPLTVLIGPNDSGKTSLLEAIWRLAGFVRPDLPAHELPASLRRDRSRHVSAEEFERLISRRQTGQRMLWDVAGGVPLSFQYRLEVACPPHPPSEQLRLNDVLTVERARDSARYENQTFGSLGNKTSISQIASSQWQRGVESQSGPVARVAEELASSELYRLNPDAMRRPAPAGRDLVLSTDGDNLAAVIDSVLSGPDREARQRLEESLAKEIPTIQGVCTPAEGVGTGARVLEFVLAGNARPPVTIPAAQVSDGALLLTAFLALAYTRTPQILLIEEPENGLHPSRLQSVIDMLRRISRGDVGNTPRQVILTTHSPLLLNFVEPSEVRIFQRTPDGGTKITPMEQAPGLERMGKEYAPGELWYLLGEEDLLKGSAA